MGIGYVIFCMIERVSNSFEVKTIFSKAHKPKSELISTKSVEIGEVLM